jgi:hypothetical protein
MSLYASGVARFTAPAETSAYGRTLARIAHIDAQLAAIAEVPPPVRTQSDWYRLDRLLDLRFAIRPVPLRPSVPERAS